MSETGITDAEFASFASPGSSFPADAYLDALTAPPPPAELPDPIRAWLSWDQVVINGAVSPGTTTIKAERRWKVDRKKIVGTDRTTLTGIGGEPVDATISIRTWTSSQFVQLVAFIQLNFPKLGKSYPVPMVVSHPQLALLNCNTLYFTKIEPVYNPATREVTLVLVGVEWLPNNPASPNVTSTPVTAVDDGSPLTYTPGFQGNLNSQSLGVTSQSTVAAAMASPPSTDPSQVGPPAAPPIGDDE